MVNGYDMTITEPSSDGPAPAAFPPGATPGFTGHRTDDDLGLAELWGQMYDPTLGRFLTPDPTVPVLHFSQSWNPYSQRAPAHASDPGAGPPPRLARKVT